MVTNMVTKQEIADLHSRMVQYYGSMAIVAKRAGVTKQAVSQVLRRRSKLQPNAAIIRETRLFLAEMVEAYKMPESPPSLPRPLHEEGSQEGSH